MRATTGKRKVKLAWIMNENARKSSLKKRKLGLVKKVQELTILCDVRACLIIFSNEEANPLVWPSQELARGLLDRYFSLPDIERSKKATNQESYLRDKAGKVQEQLVKSQKKNQEAEMDRLMLQIINHSRTLSDLTMSEIYGLISYTKDKINLLRKRGELIHQPPLHNVSSLPNQPLRDEPAVAAPGGGGNGVGSNPMNHQNQYLMDQWIFTPSISTNVGIPYQENQSYIHMGDTSIHRYGSFLPDQGSGSNRANPNVEMNLMSPQNSQEGLALQSSYQSTMMKLNLNNINPSSGSSLVPMGLGLPSLEGHANPKAILRSQLGPFPSNLTRHNLNLTAPLGGEGTNSKTPIELGLQPFGTDLLLQPLGHGGEYNSAGGGPRLQPPGEGSPSAPRQGDMVGRYGANKDPSQ
ncbi:PREDICTED: MADS-box transcription factor PHERES 2 [Tarenaya hassleriana]|uniref:MADS-box transcription factor PHERES 2 n=1 Tax=Tarenaya hassleriana TaxID=28532 RepID=UPI00053C0D6A|nr:PREDICTED: MADS-box transcription factor PHERES 2 [Tarenaya hassleriana]